MLYDWRKHDCCVHHVTIPFCINKWKLCIGNNSKYCHCDCLCFREEKEKNKSILSENIKNELCESLNSVFINISINHIERLKMMHYFLYLTSILSVLFLFATSIAAIVGYLYHDFEYSFIAICSMIVLLFTLLIHWLSSYKYKLSNKSFHKFLLHYIKHHTIPEWSKKYSKLQFAIEFCNSSCCTSFDRKHGRIIIQKRQNKERCIHLKKRIKYKECKDTDCLIEPSIAHVKYNV